MSFSNIARLIGNLVADQSEKRFAAILGESPSKGARSPVLWNAAFHAHELDVCMVPMDISIERLSELLDKLDAESLFFGGAVAVPHKEAVAHWLGDRITPEARAIGAVNCLFRNDEGRLVGTNTDGEGALRSFEACFGPVRGKRVLLMGSGGVGKAVAAYFKSALGNDGSLAISGRSEAAKRFAANIECAWVEWGRRADLFPEVDVLMNCTSLGNGDSVGSSPVSAQELAALPPHTVVFDVIYQPAPTALLSMAAARGLRVLDGVAMNLEQAILAYHHAAPEPKGTQATRTAMEHARQALN